MKPTLSGAFVAAELLILAAISAAAIYRAIPQESRELVQMVVVALLSHIATYVNFTWGSSEGSRSKDAALRPPEPPAPPPGG
jgi:hypothetical protein